MLPGSWPSTVDSLPLAVLTLAIIATVTARFAEPSEASRVPLSGLYGVLGLSMENHEFLSPQPSSLVAQRDNDHRDRGDNDEQERGGGGARPEAFGGSRPDSGGEGVETGRAEQDRGW